MKIEGKIKTTFKQLDKEMVNKGFYSKKEQFEEDEWNRWRMIETEETTYYKEDGTLEIIYYDVNWKDVNDFYDIDCYKFEDIRIEITRREALDEAIEYTWEYGMIVSITKIKYA